MKKLSLILALVLCITIGGVFANWIYAGTNAGDLHHHMANIALSDVNKTTKIGTYSVEQGDDTIKIKIDQKSQTAGSYDYDTVLVVTGSMKITFTPNEIYTGGAPTANFVLTSVNDVTSFKFNDDIYTKETKGDRAIFNKFDKTTATPLTFKEVEGSNVYEATITAEMIRSLIEINTFTLPTQAAYTEFSTALGTIGQIGVEVIDTTVIQ